MSYGISVSFPTLSRIQRQVAHALLTRPPLSFLNASRRINSKSSVRLECVMHAASVHPEPGSNSRNHFYYNLTLSGESTICFRVFLLASITLLSIYNSLTRMYFALCFALYFSSCCSIFNDRFAAFFRDSFDLRCLLKKVLTKGGGCGIIAKLSRKRDSNGH